MGQICSFCSDPDEADKPKILGVPESTSLLQDEHSLSLQEEQVAVDSSSASQQPLGDSDADAERALREEQARLELIVSTAGRDMVAVRSTRATPGYYDQGFAAALAQHLQEQIGSTSALPKTLPPISSNISVYSTLNKSPWENIQLGTKTTGLAGCAGENPNTYMDHVAESFLASMVPTKEHLFAHVGPMVENLL